MSDETARLARAERADAAMQEFVGPALATIRSEYAEKLMEIVAKHPMRGEPLAMVEKLGTALKIVDQIEIQMRALIADGDAAKFEAARADQMARLNTEQRRYVNY
ncbi:hypothetical protein SAQ01S_07180 [Sphingomonas aquatilis NBRC 16722]|uniref:Uncharacterized protein n=1 Tax=Sphingomonas aquatilis TaxID=93063 RepID=A0AAW3TSD7_9SPHN|nr:hypothetical protein [Sphingomonas aquatilis]MBB3876098.1 hypothetical protein [Sphingomonas aquatilis]GEM70952.1 hypothetical protein SAQ01S_07180 [Sphingomonas aquatilis NBRC 16722]